jgi:hypothetical protein
VRRIAGAIFVERHNNLSHLMQSCADVSVTATSFSDGT